MSIWWLTDKGFDPETHIGYIEGVVETYRGGAEYIDVGDSSTRVATRAIRFI